MTSEIAAPAAGGAMDGLLANEVVVVGEKPETAVVFGLCVGPDWPAPVCEHPATSTESVTRTAIRIPTG
jgi:hypothetical protein